jgi:ADP-ribose pyrophosphatase
MAENSKPQPLSRKLIYQSSWINLFVDKVRMPNGTILDQYHLIEFPFPAVMAIVRGLDELYLMVKVSRYPTGRSEWEFPAGRLEAGETVIQAAEREILEETGYHSVDHQHIYAYNPMSGITNQVFHVVRCRIVGTNGSFDESEISAVRWFSEDEIWYMIRNNEMMDGYTLTAFLLDHFI